MVKLALQRMNEGSYGICLHCEEPINPKRLAAVPWAPYCIRCQEAIDQRQAPEEELEDLLMNAA
jgi:DnaK suppressor protein